MGGKRFCFDVLKRHVDNPLITIEDIPFRCSAVWNAAVTIFENRYIMLVTIEELEGTYCIYKAESDDGLHFVFDNDTPAFIKYGADAREPYRTGGIRDARITFLAGSYYISYVVESRHGHRIALLKTRDFKTYESYPYASQVDVKSGPLFPEKIDGSYCLLQRPDPGSSLWLFMSKDLSFWGHGRCIMAPRGGYWDSNRIGPAGPPIRIEQGWLLVYYGVKVTSAGPLVRLGAVVLDSEEPWKVTGRSNITILSPRKRYERLGDVPNVVFSCGAIVEDDIMHVYYGASDNCICRASGRIDAIVDVCLNGSREGF